MLQLILKDHLFQLGLDGSIVKLFWLLLLWSTISLCLLRVESLPKSGLVQSFQACLKLRGLGLLLPMAQVLAEGMAHHTDNALSRERLAVLSIPAEAEHHTLGLLAD